MHASALGLTPNPLAGSHAQSLAGLRSPTHSGTRPTILALITATATVLLIGCSDASFETVQASDDSGESADTGANADGLASSESSIPDSAIDGRETSSPPIDTATTPDVSPDFGSGPWPKETCPGAKPPVTFCDHKSDCTCDCSLGPTQCYVTSCCEGSDGSHHCVADKFIESWGSEPRPAYCLKTLP